jgi:nitrate reductase gamma subunit
VPLGIELCLIAAAWLFVPRLVHTPMATISLFAPDMFLSIVLLSALGLTGALARTILMFRPSAMTV